MIQSRQGQYWPLTLWSCFLALAPAAAVAKPHPADLVITGGRVYTGADREAAAAIAVSRGKIVYVGANARSLA